jgi:hypothetical protein
MKPKFWILLIATHLFFYGCATEDKNNSTPTIETVPAENNEATPTVHSSNLETSGTGFESPLSPLETPTPPPALSATPVSLDLLPTSEPPAPEEDVGAVYGRIIDSEGVPVSDLVVRLGEVVWLEGKEGEEGLVLSDRYRAPQSKTDQWGNFAITDIPPNGYGIVIMEPIKNEPLFVIDPSGEKLRIIEIEAGSVINLDEIAVSLE